MDFSMADGSELSAGLLAAAGALAAAPFSVPDSTFVVVAASVLPVDEAWLPWGALRVADGGKPTSVWPVGLPAPAGKSGDDGDSDDGDESDDDGNDDGDDGKTGEDPDVKAGPLDTPEPMDIAGAAAPSAKTKIGHQTIPKTTIETRYLFIPPLKSSHPKGNKLWINL